MASGKQSRLLSLLLAGATAMSLSLAPLASAEAADASGKLDAKQFGQPEKLFAPITAVSIYDGAVGKEDSHNVMYTTVKGSPAVFQVVDLDDYKLLRTYPLEGAGDSWHHEVAADGSVYITAGTKLWKYSPVTKEVKAVASFTGESSLWALTTDPAGNAYVGTYPGGKVFKYDSVTGQTTDYGRMIGAINQEYVRSIAYHDGFVYAGTAHSQIVRLNLATGEKTDIAASLNEDGFCYDLDKVDNRYLFARYNTSKNMHIYDLQNQQWLGTVIPNVSGLHVTNSLNGKVYMVADNKLKAFDLQTRTVEETPMEYLSSLRGADWVEIENDPDLPGKSLATIQFGGGIAFFNIAMNKVKVCPPVVQGQPLPINEIVKAQDGKLYMSSFASSLGAIYDPPTGQQASMTIGQADSMAALGGKLYMGTYPGAKVYEFDTAAAPGPKTRSCPSRSTTSRIGCWP